MCCTLNDFEAKNAENVWNKRNKYKSYGNLI